MQAFYKKKGFTIVELILVVVIIAIMATISIFGISSWRSRTATTELKNALLSAATAMKAEKNVGDGYPATFPSSYSNSSTIVLELASSTATSYCINGYSKVVSETQMSVSSSYATPRQGLCSATSGSAPIIGGTIPNAPLGKDLAPALSTWTLAGGATYSATNGIVPGVGGSAVSPMIRIKGPLASVSVDGNFYATTQSPYVTFQPDGGWVMGIAYFASDATTPVVNSGTGSSSNGAAKKIMLNQWGSSLPSASGFSIGSNVYYVKITVSGSSTGYSSPDLKIKAITLTLQ